MRTLYVDIFFLINLTVDMLAVYFASVFSAVPTTGRRILVSSALGALIAVLSVVLADKTLLNILWMLAGIIVITAIGAQGAGIKRRFRFAFSFVIFEALCGAVVSFMWNIFDKYLYGIIKNVQGGTVNRKLLILAVSILISLGVIKVIVAFFSDGLNGSKVRVEICFIDKRVELDAFVDTGNFAVDPMDMRPVMLIKRSVANKLFPAELVELRDPDLLDRETRKRIRLIPMSNGGSTHVLTGVRPDSAKIISDKGIEELRLTVAIDREGGDYGGYEALIPASALGNVIV